MSAIVDFEEAAEAVKKLKKDPSNEDKLTLYGLFKQAKVGDVNIDQPWAIQVEARAKWDAWNKQKGKSSDAAKGEYVDLVNNLINNDE